MTELHMPSRLFTVFLWVRNNLVRPIYAIQIVWFVRLSLPPRSALVAENLFLRKQLALYLDHYVKPRRAKAATKLTLVVLSRRFAWREALTVVKPETFIRWHREGFRLFWRWRSKPVAVQKSSALENKKAK
jgi:hypothetical protein